MTPIAASCHQNRPAGVVRKDRSYANVFGIGDRQNPGGLLFSKNLLHEKGSPDNEIHADTERNRTVPAIGPTRQYSTGPGTFSAIGQGCACLRAAVSTQPASTGVTNHCARITAVVLDPNNILIFHHCREAEGELT